MFVLILVPALGVLPERQVELSLVVASLVSLALIFLFLVSGVTQDVVLMPRERHTFGTDGVPFFYNVVFGAASLVILYVFKYRKRGRWVILGTALLVATQLFFATDARGGYYALLGFVALLFLIPTLARSAIARTLVAMFPLVVLATSLSLVRFSEDVSVNEFFSYRPALYQRFIQRSGLEDLLLATQ
ncbi:hypothetical protein [Aeromicrobium sp. UC242_57]|uniref:hypothetical protein n=1 Tax=Aeromicrobium sp. UC242_57 TaxID=3374624 RepID=UPI00379F3424